MSTSQKAKVLLELAASMVDFTLMADSGDHQIFTVSGGQVFSGKSGQEPELRPNGITEGTLLLSPHASNDTVTVAAHKAWSKGVEYSVAAGSQAVTRPTTENFKISSVIMTDEGNLGEAQGAEGTEFSETRGANGGPPLIPEDAVELGQVRMNAQTPAVITASEIYQNPGDHAEYYDSPAAEIYPIGDGNKAKTAAEKYAHVKFNTPLPLSHTGSVAKRVYIRFYTPLFTTLSRTSEFKAAELGISKSSESYYQGAGGSGAIGSVSADSVGDSSFKYIAKDGITDPIFKLSGEKVTAKFFSDANRSPYILTQGVLGVDRDFPSGSQNSATITVYAEHPSAGFDS
ncbi:hypothetical protein [uncultured Desulfosarcina sp.]|uniref:hypothetical protein n=1 Tax=uncultured Desulfosarcina sp. TaxID=218289 RepID=UPI0029C811BE|nr:hypothetical protein [uncultured Desulfosarcina sp.]